MIVIAGGGPAGAATACLLAGAGRPVTLLERETEPAHKICGEFISIEAQHDLAAIGVDLARLDARPITRVRLVRGSRIAEADLPFTALSLSRKTLDAALLDQATRAGAQVLRGHAVRSIAADGALDVAGLGRMSADAVFLATGKHEMRGQRRRVGRAGSELIGFKNYFSVPRATADALRTHVEVILFPGGYAGLQGIEGDLVNLCLLVEAGTFAAAGGTWDCFFTGLLRAAPHLRRRLGDAVPVLDRPLTIAQVPYGFVHAPAPGEPDTLYRLGDQVGVIPSFCGDGIAIALRSAHVAATMHLAGAPAGAYHRRIGAGLRRQILPAALLQRVGQSRLGGAGLFALARAWPRLLGLVARHTRVAA